MADRVYLRPTAFVDAPFGLDGRVVRLAGGLSWFSAVEILSEASMRPVPVEGIEAALGELPAAARTAWERLTAPRPPLTLGERVIRLDQPQVAGIVNVTPDSFSGDGRYRGSGGRGAGRPCHGRGRRRADRRRRRIHPAGRQAGLGGRRDRAGGAGGETLAASGTAVSIDTRKAAVMTAALAAGARLVNDVSALTWDERAAETVAAAGCPVVLMHHQGTPETMQQNPRYDRPVLLEVYDWLEARIEAAVAAESRASRIIVDPGFGFGKTVQHTLQLMNGLALLHGLGCPVMVGASRKRTIGALSNEAPADQRLGGSIALALKAVEQGVHLLRVHDVPETVQALRVWRGLRDAALAP